MTTRTTPPSIDDVSKAIIELLQKDGRRSYAEIGKAVGLSEAAVRQRVQRLTESGVMQIVAVTDPLQLGFFRQAMIGIKVVRRHPRRRRGPRRDPRGRLRRADGRTFDILAEVVCENDDDLISLLNSEIRVLDGRASTETFVYLKLHKQFYNWGTR